MKAIILSALLLCNVIISIAQTTCDPAPGTPVNAPLGNARGINPGRVAWSHKPQACSWDGQTMFWFNDSFVNYPIVRGMLSDTLKAITGAKTEPSAWDSLFRYYNQQKRGINQGYNQNEMVAIKINLNTDPDGYVDNNGNSLSPQFLKSVLDSLVNQAGVPQQNIFVYDAAREIVPYLFDEPTGAYLVFPKVHYVDNRGTNGRELVKPDPITPFFFSDPTVPNYDMTELPVQATQATYFVVVDNFRGHDLAGVTLSGKNWFGSIHRPCCPDPYCGDYVNGVCQCQPALGNWCPASLHWYVNESNPMGSYSPLVDLMGHPHLGGKAVVWLMDGLYGGPTEQPEDGPIIFESQPFNGHWSCSVFGSQDPVALDSVAFDILMNEPNIPYASEGCVDNYLHEAALADNPPSGTSYNPSGDQPLSSLGVHEHRNNNIDRKYSRNLGIGNGIELLEI